MFEGFAFFVCVLGVLVLVATVIMSHGGEGINWTSGIAALIFLVAAAYFFKSAEVSAQLSHVANNFEAAAETNCRPAKSDEFKVLNCSSVLDKIMETRNKILSENSCLRVGSRWWVRQPNGGGGVVVNTTSHPICAPWPF